MPFEPNKFKDGDVLYAAHLNRIEEVVSSLVDQELTANLKVQSNWDETDPNSDNFIANRPLWLSDGDISWDGVSGTITKDVGHLLLSESVCRVTELLNSTISFTYNNISYSNKTISAYIKNAASLNNIFTNENQDLVVALVDYGSINGTDAPGNNVRLQALFIGDTEEDSEIITLGYYYSKIYLTMGTTGLTDGGLYVIPKDTSSWTNQTIQYGFVNYLKYKVVTTNENYNNFFFGNAGESNLHMVAASSMEAIDFTQYNPGDVVVVYIGSLADVPLD